MDIRWTWQVDSKRQNFSCCPFVRWYQVVREQNEKQEGSNHLSPLLSNISFEWKILKRNYANEFMKETKTSKKKWIEIEDENGWQVDR